MNRRDFFKVAIKLFGLYAVVVYVFPSLRDTAYMLIEFNEFNMASLSFANLVVSTVFSYYLLFKSDDLITRLKLEEGIDADQINIGSFGPKQMIYLASIIIGGLVFVQALPSFLSNTYFAIKADFQTDYDPNGINFGSTSDYIYWASSLLRLIIGYLLVRNAEGVANRLSRN